MLKFHIDVGKEKEERHTIWKTKFWDEDRQACLLRGEEARRVQP
jgi:hypothetical protein